MNVHGQTKGCMYNLVLEEICLYRGRTAQRNAGNAGTVLTTAANQWAYVGGMSGGGRQMWSRAARSSCASRRLWHLPCMFSANRQAAAGMCGACSRRRGCGRGCCDDSIVSRSIATRECISAATSDISPITPLCTHISPYPEVFSLFFPFSFFFFFMGLVSGALFLRRCLWKRSHISECWND